MDSVREAWTDERLDDLVQHMDEGFRQVDSRFDRVERDMRAFKSETNARFDRLDARFDSMQRAMFQLSCVMIAALIGLIATQL